MNRYIYEKASPFPHYVRLVGLSLIFGSSYKYELIKDNLYFCFFAAIIISLFLLEYSIYMLTKKVCEIDGGRKTVTLYRKWLYFLRKTFVIDSGWLLDMEVFPSGGSKLVLSAPNQVIVLSEFDTYSKVLDLANNVNKLLTVRLSDSLRETLRAPVADKINEKCVGLIKASLEKTEEKKVVIRFGLDQVCEEIWLPEAPNISIMLNQSGELVGITIISPDEVFSYEFSKMVRTMRESSIVLSLQATNYRSEGMGYVYFNNEPTKKDIMVHTPKGDVIFGFNAGGKLIGFELYGGESVFPALRLVGVK